MVSDCPGGQNRPRSRAALCNPAQPYREGPPATAGGSDLAYWSSARSAASRFLRAASAESVCRGALGCELLGGVVVRGVPCEEEPEPAVEPPDEAGGSSGASGASFVPADGSVVSAVVEPPPPGACPPSAGCVVAASAAAGAAGCSAVGCGAAGLSASAAGLTGAGPLFPRRKKNVPPAASTPRMT